MTNAHTPGPWRVSTSGNVVADLPNGDHLFIAYPKHPEQPTVESPMRDANAALIAAAPELLAACKATLAKIISMEIRATWGEAQTLAAAIAKAEGRS